MTADNNLGYALCA